MEEQVHRPQGCGPDAEQGQILTASSLLLLSTLFLLSTLLVGASRVVRVALLTVRDIASAAVLSLIFLSLLE